MARTVNEQEYAEKRKEILEAAQRLVMTRGYERMTIGDILAELKISSGAFYHYFPSKPAVLEALIEYMMQQAERSFVDLVHDPNLTGLEKLQRFFGWLDQARTAQQANIVELGRIWYTDENAIVRQKVDETTLLRRSPLVSEIVRQGVQEGILNTPYPDQAGEIVLALVHAMGNTHARIMLSILPGVGDDSSQTDDRISKKAEEIVITLSAYMTAIERVVGAPVNSLMRVDIETAKAWLFAVQGARPA